VSRRLSLVRTLPDPIQQHVHAGQLVAHAAMKYFVPLARANAADCVRLVEAIAPHGLTTRQIGRLYEAYVDGPDATRALVLTDPLLVLRVADDGARAAVRPDASAPEALLTDLHILGAVARRAYHRLQHGGGLLPPERERAWRLGGRCGIRNDDIEVFETEIVERQQTRCRRLRPYADPERRCEDGRSECQSPLHVPPNRRGHGPPPDLISVAAAQKALLAQISV
jgi:hypothetical protein